jgi:hypothetical protein
VASERAKQTDRSAGGVDDAGSSSDDEVAGFSLSFDKLHLLRQLAGGL